MDLAREHAVREAAMQFLRGRQAVNGGLLGFGDVRDFVFEGERIPLLDLQRGIRKPAQLDAAISIRTVHAPPDRRPYDDGEGPDGLLRYKWRGDNPEHPENRALRAAFTGGLPLIWFFGVAPGLYEAIHPAWLAGEEPALQQFVVILAEEQRESLGLPLLDRERRYNLRLAWERVHQRVFRSRVLLAYGRTCAICRLRHDDLLDAAHIIEDSFGGEPVVPNGLSLCKLHHAAYDADLLGISPDRHVHIKADLLAEVDGPTLKHSLQGLNGATITIPTTRAAWPDPARLDQRFQRFLRTG